MNGYSPEERAAIRIERALMQTRAGLAPRRHVWQTIRSEVQAGRITSRDGLALIMRKGHDYR